MKQNTSEYQQFPPNVLASSFVGPFSTPVPASMEGPTVGGTPRGRKATAAEQKRGPNQHPKIPAPLTGGLATLVFWARRPCDPARRSADPAAEAGDNRGLRLLLLKAGDIETNPGPPRPNTKTWTCDLCTKTIARNQYSILCNSIPSHWIHKKCSAIRLEQYHNEWTCRLHSIQPPNQLHTPTRQTDSRPTDPDPTPDSPDTTHVTTQPTQTDKTPKPTTRQKTQTWTCDLCNKTIANYQYSILCNSQQSHWIHKHCSSITLRQYHNDWTCRLHPIQPPNSTPPRQTATPDRQPDSDTTLNLSNTNNNSTHANINQTQPLTQPLTSNTPPAPSTPTPRPQTHNTPPSTNKKQLNILQLNINGINTKLDELTQLTADQHIDIITIQETKLRPTSKTPKIPGYTPIRQDRRDKDGGGLLTYVKSNITFTDIKLHQQCNINTIETQQIKIHLSNHKHLNIFNMYIAPRDTQNPNHENLDVDITNCLNHVLATDSTILTGDFNAHHHQWYSPTTDHRGLLISDLLDNSNHITLNLDTPTRLPTTTNQQPTSPDITTSTDDINRFITWTTLNKMSSDHLPIKITFNTRSNFRQPQYRHCYTNYKKADWDSFTNYIEDALTETNNITDVHTANKTLTHAILNADKYFIPKGKLKHTPTLLPEHIRNMINTRDQIRTQNPTDTRIHSLNRQINTEIETYKTDIWKSHLDDNWDHRQNTDKLWRTINSLSNKKPTPTTNQTITFNNKIATTNKQKANSFNKQFTNITKHKTDITYRKIRRHISNLPTTPQLITTQQTTDAIKTAKNNKSTGPDNINIQHLKHLGPIAIDYLTQIYNIALNTNTIPQIWKTAKIIPIPKPNKDKQIGSSFRPISLLSPIAKILEKIILPDITNNIPAIAHQHGFKQAHSTTTALHTLTNHIITGFNQKRPPNRTIAIALDMSKAFDTVNHHTLLNKIVQTNIPPLIIKFLSNYLRGRQAFTEYNSTRSKTRHIRTGVPQGGVLSPTLFNIYTSDIPTPHPNTHIITYADDITLYASHTNPDTIQDRLNPYLDEIVRWTKDNDLQLNATKTMTTLFTPDPAEYSNQLRLKIDNTTLPTETHPKILGLTFDPKLTFNRHIENSTTKAKKSLKIIKALTSTTWGKQKETLLVTYKTLTRPILEYGATLYGPIIKPNLTTKLQTVQNAALRTATGCTADTNIQHLHDETEILPIHQHCKLHTSILRHKAQHQHHPLHSLTLLPPTPRLMKQTPFHNTNYTTNIPSNSTDSQKHNLNTIHTDIVQTYLNSRQPNKLTNIRPLPPDKTELTLPRGTRRQLAQLRTDKCPLLTSYLNRIDPTKHPTDTCPLCRTERHDATHLFNCQTIPTDLTVTDLWTSPVEVAGLLDQWQDAIGRLEA